MGLGVLDDHKLERVPGTALLNELGQEANNNSGVDSATLKHDPTGRIVLVPRPSDSPNDPYNWPRWKKERLTITYAFACGAVGAVGPIAAAALVELAAKFDVPLSQFVLGFQGSLLVTISFGSLIFNALAVKIGKRPIYLFTTAILMVTCFWCAAGKSFASLVAARAIQGFCMGPVESLVPASIGDVWFVHERGFRSAIFNFGFLGGVNLAQPIAGYIIQYSSYSTAFNAMGGAFGLTIIMIFFWMPETTFVRTGDAMLDTGSNNILKRIKPVYKASADHVENGGQNTQGRPVETSESAGVQEALYSYTRELLPWSGYVNHISLFNILFRPFVMLGSPAVLWSTLVFITCFSWIIGIAITLSQIFSAAPYKFSVSDVGLTNLSSLVGSILGALVSGPLIDNLAKRMSMKNGGHFEPEFRLPIMATYLLFTGTGFFAWGQAAYSQDPWEVSVIIGLGMINFGIVLGATGVVAYIVDCHPNKASEVIAIMNFIKYMLAFGLSNFLNNWVRDRGARSVFFTIGSVTMAVTLFTIPMYIYGKKARSWVYRHNITGDGLTK